MNGRRALVVLGFAALLALAGCTGGDATTTTPGETTTQTVDVGATATTPDGTTTTTGDGTGSEDGDGSDRDPYAVTLPETSPVDATVGTVRGEAVDANRSVTDYRVIANQTIRTAANNVVQRATVNQSVTIDREAPAYRVETTQALRGQTVETAQYLVDGTVYTRGQGNVRQYGAEWTALNASNVTESLWSQDLLRRASQDLHDASLSVAGGTTVDDTPVYVLRADLNETAFGEVRGLGNGSTVHDAAGVYYVGQSDGRLYRYDLAINWTLSLSGAEADQRIGATQRFSYPEVSVTLPSAADGAVDITDQVRGDTDEDRNGTANRTEDPVTNGTDGDGSEGIAVRNGTLAVDPDRQFRRVEAALGANVTDPRAVVIEEPLNASDGGNESDDDRVTPAELLGLEAESLVGTDVTVGPLSIPYEQVAEVRVGGLGNVYLRSSPSMPESFVRLLATHEFVHYVQFQSGGIADANAATDLTADGRYARLATTEGAAVFTTNSVFRANDSTALTNSDLYAGITAEVDPGSLTAYGNSQYVEGREYVASRVDDPSALGQVYDSPPTTSEQVLHGLRPSEEPPAPMTVSVRVDGNYTAAGNDRKGEAYLRHILANGVSLPRASAAAAGWGNDTVRSLRPTDGGNTSFVWIQRWDDAGEATEFATVARDYLDNHGTSHDGTTLLSGRPVTLRAPGDRTTALVIAPESLQDRLSIDVDGREVVVTG